MNLSKRLIWLSWVLVAPALLVGCDLLARQEGLPRWGKQTYESVSTPTFTGVIIPANRAKELVEPLCGVQSQGYWTPSRDDILRLEGEVVGYLLEAARQRSPDLWRKLHRYRRQYAGMTRDGRRIVLGNYFCDAHGVDWVARPMVVLDGGDCFFSLEYDAQLHTFSNLHINGES